MNRPRTVWHHLLEDRKVRRNVWALGQFVLGLIVVILVFSVLFQVLAHLEGSRYSWITGFYWTLTTMTTLGYGDVVFVSDLGRVFSLVVLMTGIVTIFVVLPFTFIRYLYTPLVEAQLRKNTPREVPAGAEGHVIICAYNELAAGFLRLLEQEGIPYYVIEPDLETAAHLYLDGISVVVGEFDNRETYEALRADKARLVLANLDDPENTNIILTVREAAPETPIAALARMESAVEILELSGATHVLPLNRWLGEQLANRVNASHAQSHVLGRYQDLHIAELPVHMTPMEGKTIRETRLREAVGVNIVAVWQRGRLHPARPDMPLTPGSVPVVIGTAEQLEELDYLLTIYDYNPNPVPVIGAGPVGIAAVRSLERKDIPVHLIEKDPALYERARKVCRHVILGDATDPQVLIEAGIREAPSVVLTTSDDAMNIFLASHCRRMNPEMRIVSRITHERNIEAIHRAGADLVLGSASLGVQATFSLLKGRQLIVIGEGVDLFSTVLPASLQGKTLAESGIGARTSLTVVAIQQNGRFISNPSASTVLSEGSELLMFGDRQQRQKFSEVFSEEAH